MLNELDNLAQWLTDYKWDFTEVAYHDYGGGEYVEIDQPALRKLIGEYFSDRYGDA